MRLEGKIKLGFYPLPVTEADRIRRFLRYAEKPCAAIDPCIGDGVASATITSVSSAQRSKARSSSVRNATCGRSCCRTKIHRPNSPTRPGVSRPSTQPPSKVRSDCCSRKLPTAASKQCHL